MTQPIIKTDNYILITSDEEIKEGDYILSTKSNSLFKADSIEYYKIHNLIEDFDKSFYINSNASKKVIAHLPLNSPIIEGVPLLPPLPNDEDDLDKESDKYAGLIGNKDGTAKFDFKRGYNKAKEKYKFTEEDMKLAIEIGEKVIILNGRGSYLESKQLKENFIQSFSQPKLPVGFKCAMETSRVPYGDDGWKTVETGYKITNGVMQGEWIFE